PSGSTSVTSRNCRECRPGPLRRREPRATRGEDSSVGGKISPWTSTLPGERGRIGIGEIPARSCYMTQAANAAERPRRLRASGGLSLAAWSIVAAFGAYFCTYAFRKPFTAAAYADLAFATVTLKTLFVAAQVIGYTLSKFIGIKFVAEAKPSRRA